MPLLFGCVLACGLVASGVGCALASGVAPGDLVVVDHQSGAVIRVAPVTGAQEVLLNGPAFTDVATEQNGRFAATYSGPSTSGVGEIDPDAGTFSPFSPTTPWSLPLGVSAGMSSHILVADQFAFVGCSTGGTVFDVDPVSGAGTAVLCLHAHPLDVVLEASDSILIASQVFGLVRFAPATQAWRVLAGRDPIFNPYHIALATNGVIYVISMRSGSSTPTDVYRIDPVSGAREVVSGGGQFVNLQGIAVATNGDILVADADALPDGTGAKGAIFRVNPTTGVQAPVSSGGAFRSPGGIAIAGQGDVDVPPLQRVPRFELCSFPNPAMKRADISFVLPGAARVRLEIFDPEGRLVATLIENAPMDAGSHHAALAAGTLQTGVYLVRLEVGSQTATQAMMVVH